MTISKIIQGHEQISQRTNYRCSVLTNAVGTLLLTGGSVAVFVAATSPFIISGVDKSSFCKLSRRIPKYIA